MAWCNMLDQQLAEKPADTSLLEWIDELADRFEAAWRSGTPPDLTEFVNEATGSGREALPRLG